MLESSYSLNELKSVGFEYQNALTNAFKRGVSYNRDPHKEEEFQDVLKNLLEIFDNDNPQIPSLRRGSLDFEPRENYIDNVLEKVKKYRGMDSSRLYLSKIGWTAMVFATAKPILDMYDSWDKTRIILESEKRGEGNYNKAVQSLQDSTMSRLEKYVSSHEGKKLVEVERFRNRYPEIERPFVRVSGSYNSTNLGQSRLVAAFGELFDPTLMLINKNDEDINRLKSNMQSLPIKKETKNLLLKEIKMPTSLDDLLVGHPQNFELYVGNLMNIVNVISDYFHYHDRRYTCFPFFEWEAICTVLFPQNLVGQKTFYDPEAINLKIGFVNAARDALGYEPLLTAEELTEKEKRRRESRSYIS